MVKKAAGWAVVVFAAWWVATDPHAAAAFAHLLLSWLGHAGQSVSAFLSGL